MALALLSQVCTTLAVSGEAAEPLPTEFLLFAAGVNRTVHGEFVFDAQSARDVMAEFRKRGTDMMIDLEHFSVRPEVVIARADARDAMGYFTPEVRADGSLWATAVRWSAEGERRLRGRLQRYTSPAAYFDQKTRRVVRLVNSAICSDPATYGNAPLMAASASRSSDAGALRDMCKALLVRVITERHNAKR
jgi:phage I-like protein